MQLIPAFTSYFQWMKALSAHFLSSFFQKTIFWVLLNFISYFSLEDYVIPFESEFLLGC